MRLLKRLFHCFISKKQVGCEEYMIPKGLTDEKDIEEKIMEADGAKI